MTAQRVLEPHYDRTKQRIAENPVALLVQDTTELDLTRPEKQVVGSGSVDGSSRRGGFLHLTEAFTEDGTPLGAVGADIWARPEEEVSLSQQDKQKQRKVTPIEQKESFRWLEGLRRASTCERVADDHLRLHR